MTGKVEGTDTLVSLPLLAGVTYNEAHSLLLGLVGVLAGTGYRIGYELPVAGFTVFAVALAFGLRLSDGDSPIARRVVRREPWYFLVSYVGTGVAAALAPVYLG